MIPTAADVTEAHRAIATAAHAYNEAKLALAQADLALTEAIRTFHLLRAAAEEVS